MNAKHPTLPTTALAIFTLREGDLTSDISPRAPPNNRRTEARGRPPGWAVLSSCSETDWSLKGSKKVPDPELPPSKRVSAASHAYHTPRSLMRWVIAHYTPHCLTPGARGGRLGQRHWSSAIDRYNLMSYCRKLASSS